MSSVVALVLVLAFSSANVAQMTRVLQQVRQTLGGTTVNHASAAVVAAGADADVYDVETGTVFGPLSPSAPTPYAVVQNGECEADAPLVAAVSTAPTVTSSGAWQFTVQFTPQRPGAYIAYVTGHDALGRPSCQPSAPIRIS